MTTNPFAEPLADLEIRNPATADAERIRHEHLRAETNIKSVALLHIITGGFGTIIVIFMIGMFIWSGLTSDMLGMGVAEMALILVVTALYPLMLAGGIALRRFKMWGRYVAVGFASFGLLGIPLGTIISALFLYILLNKKANYVFTEEYQEIIRQTPHIRYKTSPVVWAVLAVIVLLSVAGVVMATYA